MDDGVLPIAQRPERRTTERRATPRPRPAGSGTGDRRKAPAKPRPPEAGETVADRIDPLIARPEPKKQAPRKRVRAPGPPVETPTAETAVFDDLLVLDEPVVERVPYVLPKIVPGEPEPGDEPALKEAPAPKSLKRKLSGLKPHFTRVARSPEKLARSLQPVVLPRHRPRVRRVTRVVRHIDTWSVFKIALLFNVFLYAVCLTAGVMLWRVALNTGTIENIERFFESFGWQTFELKGGEIYHNAWIAGLFGVVGVTGLAVLAATMFNLITDLVGGVRVTVLEEEVTGREPHVVSWPRLLRPATPPHEPEPPIN